MGNKKKPTDPFPCDTVGRSDREKLQAIYDVLDEHIGDTDPHTDIPWGDWEDDDLKAEHPLLWCCQQLSKIIGRSAEPGTPQNPDKYTEADRIEDSYGTWDY